MGNNWGKQDRRNVNVSVRCQLDYQVSKKHKKKPRGNTSLGAKTLHLLEKVAS